MKGQYEEKSSKTKKLLDLQKKKLDEVKKEFKDTHIWMVKGQEKQHCSIVATKSGKIKMSNSLKQVLKKKGDTVKVTKRKVSKKRNGIHFRHEFPRLKSYH